MITLLTYTIITLSIQNSKVVIHKDVLVCTEVTANRVTYSKP